MSRRLPNLNQLRAFEAAARHGSFKDAADELNVTHAAVSHQIKALEEDLGQQLFHRMTRQVKLTPKAEALLPALTLALDGIASAVTLARHDPLEGELSVSVAPFFGNRMVLPVLPEFYAQYPGIRIKPVMNAGLTDFEKDDFHCAIRYGKGNWPGLEEIHLTHNMVGVFAAPSYLRERQVPVSPQEIADMTLGSVSGREYHWIGWFKAQGYDPGDGLTLIEYNNKARALDLALAGNGVALDDVSLMATEVAAGRLVQIHPFVHQQDTSMYLVFPSASRDDTRIRAFGEWLASRLTDQDGLR